MDCQHTGYEIFRTRRIRSPRFPFAPASASASESSAVVLAGLDRPRRRFGEDPGTLVSGAKVCSLATPVLELRRVFCRALGQGMKARVVRHNPVLPRLPNKLSLPR